MYDRNTNKKKWYNQWGQLRLSGLHLKFTGHTNTAILNNLKIIADSIRAGRSCAEEVQPPIKLWIRTPLIPDTTATEENISAIGRYIRENLEDITERWELCAFNNMARLKYEKLGLVWPYESASLLTQDTVDYLLHVAASSGISAEKLVVSGLIARGEAS